MPSSPAAAIFGLSFATLVYAITLTRVFAYVLPYHFTAVALSLAMLGLGLGASLGGAPPPLELRVWRARALAALSASWLALYAALHVHWGLWTLAAAALLPFVALGAVISQIYGSAQSPRLAYTADLLGAAAASLAALPLFVRCGPEGILLGLAAAFSAGGLSLARQHPRGPRRASAAILGLSLASLAAAGLGALPAVGSAPGRAAQKPLHEALRRDGGRIVDFSWGSAGRADLYEQPAYRNVKWIFNDATNSSMLPADPDTPARREFLRGLMHNIPLGLHKTRRALLIGPGGGIEVQLARLAGVGHIDAVEINPASVAIVRRWSRFAGPVYDAPGVHLHIEDGRHFLSTTQAQYDLIQMSLVITGTALPGTFALAEAHLHTLEAHRLYLRRLAPGGLLAVFDDSYERSLRTALTALAALEERGVPFDRALERIVVVRSLGRSGAWNAALVLVSPDAIPANVLRDLLETSRTNGLEPTWIPGLSAREPFESLAREGLGRFLEANPLDLRPRSDNHPFFFYFGKGWRAHARVLLPVFALGGLSLLAVIAAAAATRRRLPAAGAAYAAVAALCGASFMIIEAGLLARLALATRGPGEALAVLLFSLLFWCGLGNRAAAALSRRGLPLWAACAIAAAAAGATLWAMRAGLPMAGIRWQPARVALLWLSLGPIGLGLGLPFPTLLELQSRQDRAANARLWGINGLAAVVGACLSISISFLWGIEASLWAGVGGYLAGAVLAARR